MAADATVVLMSPSDIDLSNPDDVQLDPDTLEEYATLCADERFVHQPVPGWCSGTLIGPDLVLTAGHCVEEFGNVRVDNYFWLRERENPEVIAYLEAENEYLEARLADTRELEDLLFAEIAVSFLIVWRPPSWPKSAGSC